MSKLFLHSMAAFRFVSLRKESLTPLREDMAPLPDYMVW